MLTMGLYIMQRVASIFVVLLGNDSASEYRINDNLMHILSHYSTKDIWVKWAHIIVLSA